MKSIFCFSRTLSIILILGVISFSSIASEDITPTARFDVGFSPDNGALDKIVNAINKANKSILVAAYSFTSKPIALALIAAHNRNVNVQIVADKKSNHGFYTVVFILAKQGISVRLNGNYAIHHNKFMIIDDVNLETGSFNYSSAAAHRNAENVLILWGVPKITSYYRAEWTRLWDESTPVIGTVSLN